jgi:hypothetical protein
MGRIVSISGGRAAGLLSNGIKAISECQVRSGGAPEFQCFGAWQFAAAKLRQHWQKH